MNETEINNQVQNIDLNNQYFKSLTKIDLPFIYNIFVFNDVFVNLEASNPASTPSKTTILFNETIEVPYWQSRLISNKPQQFSNKEDAKNYLLSQRMQVRFDDFQGAFVEPNDYFRLKVDEQHKTVTFYFRLPLSFKILIYSLFLIALYPILVSIAGLYRFVWSGEPFRQNKK